VGTGYWIVHGPDRTCIVQAEAGAVSCEPQTRLLREGVSLGVVRLGPPPDREAREFIVAGIVPNRIDRIELKIGDKTRVVVVRNNTYSLRAPVPIVVEHLVEER